MGTTLGIELSVSRISWPRLHRRSSYWWKSTRVDGHGKEISPRWGAKNAIIEFVVQQDREGIHTSCRTMDVPSILENTLDLSVASCPRTRRHQDPTRLGGMKPTSLSFLPIYLFHAALSDLEADHPTSVNLLSQIWVSPFFHGSSQVPVIAFAGDPPRPPSAPPADPWSSVFLPTRGSPWGLPEGFLSHSRGSMNTSLCLMLLNSVPPDRERLIRRFFAWIWSDFETVLV